jgi:hypothetical protein
MQNYIKLLIYIDCHHQLLPGHWICAISFDAAENFVGRVCSKLLFLPDHWMLGRELKVIKERRKL